ncbi:unnamed protein product [Cercopithifilaria johnstoni]|uniref:Uncharacterized protein n=1 Tax=Cercopithifilaria johnstoni TaxID=2874296 RepID=A0A8J2PT11_9BILA|nr:unnamed protein product [Cercopithifilaria johnstoni]
MSRPLCPIVTWYAKFMRTNHRHSVISNDWKREGYPGQWATGATYKIPSPISSLFSKQISNPQDHMELHHELYFKLFLFNCLQ